MKKAIMVVMALLMAGTVSMAGWKIGAKAGFPTGIGLNAETDLPLTFGLVNVGADVSYLPAGLLTFGQVGGETGTFKIIPADSIIKDASVDLIYYGVDAKVYLPLLGMYGSVGIGQGNMNITAKVRDKASNYAQSFSSISPTPYLETTATGTLSALYPTAKIGWRFTLLFLTAGLELGLTKPMNMELKLEPGTVKFVNSDGTAYTLAGQTVPPMDLASVTFPDIEYLPAFGVYVGLSL